MKLFLTPSYIWIPIIWQIKTQLFSEPLPYGAIMFPDRRTEDWVSLRIHALMVSCSQSCTLSSTVVCLWHKLGNLLSNIIRSKVLHNVFSKALWLQVFKYGLMLVPINLWAHHPSSLCQEDVWQSYNFFLQSMTSACAQLHVLLWLPRWGSGVGLYCMTGSEQIFA